jgi:membrane protein involved in colicin uptake
MPAVNPAVAAAMAAAMAPQAAAAAPSAAAAAAKAAAMAAQHMAAIQAAAHAAAQAAMGGGGASSLMNASVVQGIMGQMYGGGMPGGGAGSGLAAVSGGGPGATEITLECPAGLVGRIIGKGGETIRDLQLRSGCQIQMCVARRTRTRALSLI